MATLSVRSPVLPRVVGKRYDSIARSPLDSQYVRAAGPAHVCQQEHGQMLNMSYHELRGSHSTAHAVKVEGLQTSALRAGRNIAKLIDLARCMSHMYMNV